MDKITIVIPQGANVKDDISINLRNLTKILQEKLGGTYSYGLGGQYGYGIDFENEIFMIHYYCWCDKEDCPWCGNNAPNFLHKQSGLEVRWYKWIGRDMEISNPNKANVKKIFKECISSLSKGEV